MRRIELSGKWPRVSKKCKCENDLKETDCGYKGNDTFLLHLSSVCLCVCQFVSVFLCMSVTEGWHVCPLVTLLIVPKRRVQEQSQMVLLIYSLSEADSDGAAPLPSYTTPSSSSLFKRFLLLVLLCLLSLALLMFWRQLLHLASISQHLLHKQCTLKDRCMRFFPLRLSWKILERHDSVQIRDNNQKWNPWLC